MDQFSEPILSKKYPPYSILINHLMSPFQKEFFLSWSYKNWFLAGKRSLFFHKLTCCSNNVSHSNKLYPPLILPHVWKFFSNPHTDHDNWPIDCFKLKEFGKRQVWEGLSDISLSQIMKHSSERSLPMFGGKEHLDPWRREGAYRGIKAKQDPVGSSWAQKLFCVPSFLFVGWRVQPLRPSWIPKSRLKLLLIRGVRECRNKGEATRKL